MSNYLEVIFSDGTDRAFLRFLEINAGKNVSNLLVCALEYHILTGQSLLIGTVCPDALTTKGKVRKPIYIPQNSIIWDWAREQKRQKRGMMTVKIRRILKDSLELTADTASEGCADYTDCLLAIERAEKRDLNRTYKPEINPDTKAIISEKKEGSLKKPDNRITSRSQSANLMDSLMPPVM